MKKTIFFSLFILLAIITCVILYKGSSNTEIKVEKQEEIYSKDTCYSLVKNRDTFSITLKCIPANAKYVEVIFDSDYFGYFPVHKPIFLPMYTGQKKLIVFFANDIGKGLGIRNDYLLK